MRRHCSLNCSLAVSRVRIGGPGGHTPSNPYTNRVVSLALAVLLILSRSQMLNACRDCEYRGVLEGEPNGFRECWGTLGEVRPHLFDMHRVSSVGGRNAPRANALLREGKASLLDLSEDEITGDIDRIGAPAWRQRIQLAHTRSGLEYRGLELDQLADRYPYPLHFIDFESTGPAIPYHAGMRPYETIAFQWSCHTIREPGAQPEHAIWVHERSVMIGCGIIRPVG
jgi:hypothetical protein